MIWFLLVWIIGSLAGLCYVYNRTEYIDVGNVVIAGISGPLMFGVILFDLCLRSLDFPIWGIKLIEKSKK